MTADCPIDRNRAANVKGRIGMGGNPTRPNSLKMTLQYSECMHPRGATYQVEVDKHLSQTSYRLHDPQRQHDF